MGAFEQVLNYEILYDVLIVVAIAIVVGELFEQVQLPSVAGELLAGLLVGSSVFGFVSSSSQTQAISSIALFFIIFHIGLETESATVRRHLRRAVVLSATGFFIPLAAAFVAALIFLPLGLVPDFILALAIAVPSISIISVLVSQLHLADKLSGQVVISSVVIIDTVAFVLLAAASSSTASTVSVIIYTIAVIAVFACVDFLLNYRPQVFRFFLKRSSKYFKREDISFGLLIVIGLFVATLFQDIGVSFMVGAFFAGLIIHSGLIGRKSFETISGTFARMNRAFFIPLFFGLAGVEAAISYRQPHQLLVLAILVLISLLPALGLSYLAAKRILKLPGKVPRQASIILGGRGAVGIVIATVAQSENLISSSIYSLIIVGTLAVSIIVPVMLRDRKKELKAQSERRARDSEKAEASKRS